MVFSCTFKFELITLKAGMINYHHIIMPLDIEITIDYCQLQVLKVTVISA